MGGFDSRHAGVAQVGQVGHDLAQQRQFFLQRVVGGQPPPYIVGEGQPGQGGCFAQARSMGRGHPVRMTLERGSFMGIPASDRWVDV